MYISRIRIRPDARDLHLLIDANSYGVHQLLWKLFPSSVESQNDQKEMKRSFLFREEIAREQIPFHKGVKGESVFYTISQALPVSDHPLFAVESKPYALRLNEGDRLAFRLRANPVLLEKKERTAEEFAAWKDRQKRRGERGLPPSKALERGWNCGKVVRHDVVMDAQQRLLRELAEKTSVPAHGKKSDMKKVLLTSWRQAGDIREVEDILKQIIFGNERYKDIETRRLNTAKLLDMALKARMNKALETWLHDKGKNTGFALVRDPKGRLKFQAEGYQWHALPKKGKTAGFSSVDFEGEIEVIDPELFANVLFYGIGPAKGFGCGLMLVRRA